MDNDLILSGKLLFEIDTSTSADFSIPKCTIVSGHYVYQIRANEKITNGKICIPYLDN